MKVYNNIKRFFHDMGDSHISAYSAQASYFIIMSVFPFLLILLSIVRFTPLTEDMLMDMVSDVVSKMLYPVIDGIVQEIYVRANGVLSISVVLALWSSSKCMLAVTNGFNAIYEVDETRNYIVLRMRSCIHTVLFVLAIMVSLVLMVFGEHIHYVITEHFPVVASVFGQILDWRFLATIVLQILIFMLIYKFLPNKKMKLWKHFVGALFTTVGWNVFSYMFSLYIQYGTLSYTYGSLTTLVVIMIWLYFCMYIMFLGAQINKFLLPGIRKFLTNRKK